MDLPSGDQRGLSSQYRPSVIWIQAPPEVGTTSIVEPDAVGMGTALKTTQRSFGESLVCQRP